MNPVTRVRLARLGRMALDAGDPVTPEAVRTALSDPVWRGGSAQQLWAYIKAQRDSVCWLAYLQGGGLRQDELLRPWRRA